MKSKSTKLSKIAFVLLCVMLFSTATSKIFAASLNSETNEDTVIVDVIYTDCEEEEILKWELDDGTTVGDHNYIIQYNNAQGMDNENVSPLIDDPFGGGGGNGYFSSAAWITRDGVVSLQLAPTSKTRQSWSSAKAGWNTITGATTITSSKNWPSDSTCLYWQYECHYNFANSKTYWNLEPSRKASSYLEVVASACNP